MKRDDILLLGGLLLSVCMICALFGGIYLQIQRLPPTFEWARKTMGASTQEALEQATAQARLWTATWTPSATFTLKPSDTPVVVVPTSVTPTTVASTIVAPTTVSPTSMTPTSMTPNASWTMTPVASMTATPSRTAAPEQDRKATLEVLFSSSCTCDDLPEEDERELDCEDFDYRWVMQSCYEHCGGPVVDPYRLDGDNNGEPCEKPIYEYLDD